MRIAFIFAAAALLSAPALAEADQPKPPKEPKICRTNKQSTGTRMSKKTCKTAEQWAAEDSRSKKDVSDLQSHSR